MNQYLIEIPTPLMHSTIKRLLSCNERKSRSFYCKPTICILFVHMHASMYMFEGGYLLFQRGFQVILGK